MLSARIERNDSSLDVSIVTSFNSASATHRESIGPGAPAGAPATAGFFVLDRSSTRPSSTPERISEGTQPGRYRLKSPPPAYVYSSQWSADSLRLLATRMLKPVLLLSLAQHSTVNGSLSYTSRRSAQAAPARGSSAAPN